MARSGNAALRRVWEDRLRRYAHSGATVVAFCERERVSVPSFYQWRRKLAVSRASSADARSRERRAPTHQPQAFVPVRIIQTAPIRMRLPNGVELSLPAGDEVLLSAAIAAAGRLHAARAEAE